MQTILYANDDAVEEHTHNLDKLVVQNQGLCAQLDAINDQLISLCQWIQTIQLVTTTT